MKILLTGSKGFIGQNLTKHLKSKDYIINEISRESSEDELNEKARDSDFCIHLAGEVRPKSDYEACRQGNLVFTDILLSALKAKPIDIIFTSSIHAINPVNSYGQTKKLAEDKIKEFSSRYEVNSFIYNLPNLYGPFCKPNYNSVLATWIVNALNNDPLVITNQKMMTYIYSVDLCKLFEKQIQSSTQLDFFDLQDNISLSDLKKNIELMVQEESYEPKNRFSKNLLSTINHYKNKLDI